MQLPKNIFQILAATILLAAVTSRADSVATKIALKAEPFNLKDVRLLDGPFRDAMLRDQHYLLSLDPDRLLRNFKVNVGFPTNAKPYGGWEAPDCQLRGHSLGHYLSALSLMYASTGEDQFKRRVNYIVAQLAECQSNSPAAGFHAGYLSAFPESLIDRVEQGQPVWAPWYTLHKIMAGLLDAYQHCDNAQALKVLTNMADWVKFRVDRLTPEQMQKSLNTEQGGMTEVLANLYGVTGNTNYLQLAEDFNHQKVIAPLEQGKDELTGLHANTQIPKIVGITREYEFTGNPEFLTAADTFWDAVALHRSYVIGGDSDHEHFFPVSQFNQHLSQETCETCNTYNMLKLTHDLFSLEPSAQKMDFYERGLYNDILASQDPVTDMFTYFMSLKPGHFKVYSTPENSFWCCVGTGMENHAKYGNTIYYHNSDTLYVNLFIASLLTWDEKGISLQQETQFPESDSTLLKFKTARPTNLALKIRHPGWAVNGISVWINDKEEKIKSNPGSYFTLQRKWQTGDTVKIKFPMSLHTEYLPDTSNKVAILYGPIVLAGELGTNGVPLPYAHTQSEFNHVPDPAVPMLVCTTNELLDHIQVVSDKSLTFRTQQIGRPQDVTLIPFYQIHRQRYVIYWELLSENTWKIKSAEMRAAEIRRVAEEARVIDVVRPGEEQSEIDHQMQGDHTTSGDAYGFKWREATGWFSYRVKVLPTRPMELHVSFRNDTTPADDFDVSVDGEKISPQITSQKRSGVYLLPPSLTQGKESVIVKFAAHPGKAMPGLTGLRALQSK